MLTTLLLFLLILGLLVFVHEFGHFWAARKVGVTVHEFAFGFKPRLFAWKRGETEYAINLIPLGGYVRLEGEEEDTGKKGSLMAKKPGQRAFIFVAGVLMNLLLAWILLTAAYTIGSYPLTPTFGNHTGLASYSAAVITDVSANSPASAAGLQAGDTVRFVNAEQIDSANELIEFLKQNAGQEVTIKFDRGAESQTVTLTPRVDPPAGEGAVGIAIGESTLVRAPWYKAPFVALQELGSSIAATFVGFVSFLHQLIVRQEVSQDVSGIVGVGAAVGIVRKLGIGPLLQFTALISTSLAVINIMPIPVLDGGHLLFLAAEAVRKKPVNDTVRAYLTAAGLVLILVIMLSVTYQDFLRFSIFENIKQLF